MEDQRFCEYFCPGIAATIDVWSLLLEKDMLPENAVENHLLWAMYFQGAAHELTKDVLLHLTLAKGALKDSCPKNM